MRTVYNQDEDRKERWLDIEDFIAGNNAFLHCKHLTLFQIIMNYVIMAQQKNTQHYSRTQQAQTKRVKSIKAILISPYLMLQCIPHALLVHFLSVFESIRGLIPPRHIQPKTLALTNDNRALASIIFEDREKKGKWPEGLTKEDVMDDFNENYISCNYLIIAYYFFNFPNICFNSLIVPRDYLLFFKYIRSPMTQLYSWAIPDEDALNEIKQHSPIVEIGCGSGYLHEMKLLQRILYCREILGFFAEKQRH